MGDPERVFNKLRGSWSKFKARVSSIQQPLRMRRDYGEVSEEDDDVDSFIGKIASMNGLTPDEFMSIPDLFVGPGDDDPYLDSPYSELNRGLSGLKELRKKELDVGLPGDEWRTDYVDNSFNITGRIKECAIDLLDISDAIKGSKVDMEEGE